MAAAPALPLVPAQARSAEFHAGSSKSRSRVVAEPPRLPDWTRYPLMTPQRRTAIVSPAIIVVVVVVVVAIIIVVVSGQGSPWIASPPLPLDSPHC
jgi:hypothetical protein